MNKGIDLSIELDRAQFEECGIQFTSSLDELRELKKFFLNADVVDPYASPAGLEHEHGFALTASPSLDYDAVIISVCHEAYALLDDAYFAGITKPAAMIAGLKGVFRSNIKSRPYWSF